MTYTCNSIIGEAETGESLGTHGPLSLAYSMSAESVRDLFSIKPLGWILEKKNT